MKRLLGMSALLAALLLNISLASAQNEQEVAFGDYVANYNTFPSMFLDQNIAKAAGVKRSESHGIITLAIRKHMAGSADKPVKAAVVATATNLVGQIRKLKLAEVIDGKAIYYIGDYTIASDETLAFSVTVQPEGEMLKHEFKFTRRF